MNVPGLILAWGERKQAGHRAKGSKDTRKVISDLEPTKRTEPPEDLFSTLSHKALGGKCRE